MLCLACAGLSACRKDYTCECTTNDGLTQVSSSTIHEKKAKAKKICESGSKTYGFATLTCVIK